MDSSRVENSLLMDDLDAPALATRRANGKVKLAADGNAEKRMASAVVPKDLMG